MHASNHVCDEQVLLEGDISALSAKVGAVEGSEDEAEEGEEEGAEEENDETTADGDEGRSGEGSSATAGLRDACTRERTVDGGSLKTLIVSTVQTKDRKSQYTKKEW